MAFTKWENATTENGQTVFTLCFDQLELCLICPQGAHRFFWRFIDGDQSYTSISLSKSIGKLVGVQRGVAQLHRGGAAHVIYHFAHLGNAQH